MSDVARWFEELGLGQYADVTDENAVGLLASVYGWFTAGFDTPDMKDANALLDELQ